MRMLIYILVILVASFACFECQGGSLKGPVRNALTLDELEQTAKVIFKGTVVSSEPVEDESIEDLSGYQPYETIFNVISVFKGEIAEEKQMTFRHYSLQRNPSFSNTMPQSYNFEVGKHYFVCANAAAENQDTPRVVRQINWDRQVAKQDQGVLASTNNQPHRGKLLSEIYWNELTDAINSPQPASQVYAITQLNKMSSTSFDGHQSFKRDKVVDVIANSIQSEDDSVATAAMKLVGAQNYGGGIYELIRLNPKHFQGHNSSVVLAKPSRSAQSCSEKLIAMANSTRSSKLRSVAIKALLNSANPKLYPLATKWSQDDSELVRAAAAILLADYSQQVTLEQWKQLMDDSSAEVRKRAVRGIGVGQIEELLDEVESKLDDEEPSVAGFAVATMMSFPIEKTRSKFQKHVKHPEYGCLFVNVLAAENPEDYLEELGQVIRTDPHPKGWWGGRVPWGVSWELLFKYAQQHRGNIDDVLDSLESPVRDFEGSNHFSSSQPRDLYALYVQRGMRRAKSYRKAVNEKTSYDMEYYFKQVDERPDSYLHGN